MLVFNPFKLWFGHCHVKVDSNSAVDSIVPPQIEPEKNLIFSYVKVSISKFDYASCVTLAGLRIDSERPLAFQTLEVITLDTHLVIHLVAFATLMSYRVKKELIVTGRAVICAIWIIVVIGGFNAVVIKHQRVFFLTRELNVR